MKWKHIPNRGAHIGLQLHFYSGIITWEKEKEKSLINLQTTT